jgi:formylglycine-generating enzyme required for sulfatase activity
MFARIIVLFNLLVCFAAQSQDSILHRSQSIFIDLLLEEFVKVDGGKFHMGSVFYDLDELKHKVQLPTFYIQKNEVSQALYASVMGVNPSANKSNINFPVTNVSWEDCQRFIEKLNEITGKKFRLPTEAEWEYAAQGGQLSRGYAFSGSDTLTQVAWYLTNSDGVLHEIRTKEPNELGLYDLSGNVWEWCQDWYGKYGRKKRNPLGPTNGKYRVLRGGSFGRDKGGCRVSYRSHLNPDHSNSYSGFRLVLEDE